MLRKDKELKDVLSVVEVLTEKHFNSKSIFLKHIRVQQKNL